MYMSVRKPLLSTKSSGKSGGLCRDGGGVLDQPRRSAMPSVSKTSPSPKYSQNGGNNFLVFNKQRGKKSSYQTTNSLFEGRVRHSGLSKNFGDNGVSAPCEEGGVSGEGAQHNGYVCSVVEMRPPPKYHAKRNVSDNVAAVLGGTTFLNGERLGNGATRKAFSGPSSSRPQQSQQGGGGGSNDCDGVQQRPHPPGSGGPKHAVRHTQFVLNSNSGQPIPPLLPRASFSFSQPCEHLGTASVLQGQARERTQISGDPFDTTHNVNGLRAKFALEPDKRGTQWDGNMSQSFPLASTKLQRLASPCCHPSAGGGLDFSTSMSPSCRRSSGGPLNGAKIPAAVEEGVGKTNGLQYEFRVVASTGKSFNSPIKLTAGFGCLQGLRPTMEDEHFVRLNAATVAGQTVSLLGILDGHCGRRVAELASKHVPDNFVAHSALGENNALALVESIIQADRAIFHTIGRGTTSGSNVRCNGGGGSTLIAAAVHGRMLYVACLGDARAVLYDGHKTIPMSEDHKPTSKKEHTRILQCGGFVQFGRVCGILAVSRALGDYEFKFNGNRFLVNRELMVSNVADVRQINLTDSSKFLVMACDGLWDVVANEEATQFVREFLTLTGDVGLSSEVTQRALNNCCQKLAQFAVDRGSSDNVSVIVLFFHDVAEVVASFGGLCGALRSPTCQNVSPRLSCPSRGVERAGGRMPGGAGRTRW